MGFVWKSAKQLVTRFPFASVAYGTAFRADPKPPRVRTSRRLLMLDQPQRLLNSGWVNGAEREFNRSDDPFPGLGEPTAKTVNRAWNH